MRRRWLLLVLLAALAGCSRCSRQSALAPADASAADAAIAAAVEEWALEPVAFTSGQGVLTRLADGTIVFTHGSFIDRLTPDGHRQRLARVRGASRLGPLGSVGGTAEELFVSDVVDNYPSSTDSHSWRLTLGADAGASERSILRESLFYAVIAPWKDGSLLGLRATGAAFSVNTMLPWSPEAFAIIRGGARPPKMPPKIPPHMFLEDMIAFPSGTVLAAATKFGGDGVLAREGRYAVRWKDGAVEPAIEPLPETDDGVSQHIVARSEDDAWIGGKNAWFAHWDGKTWSSTDSSLGGTGTRSMAIASDGTLWSVSEDHELSRRAPDGTWSKVELPTVRSAFTKPRLGWDRGGELRVAYERDVAIESEALAVVASGDDVWVAGEPAGQGLGALGFGMTLFHWTKTSGGGDAGASSTAAVVDLDEEDGRDGDDDLRPPNATCPSFFLSGGPPTETALSRVRAAPMTIVVIARLRGQRVLGSRFDGSSREVADEQATKWRSLGLPAELHCGYPPLESLVIDPNAKDE